jgi:hypothetical protein
MDRKPFGWRPATYTTGATEVLPIVALDIWVNYAEQLHHT